MNRIPIEFRGMGWITVEGAGPADSRDRFIMTPGILPEPDKSMLGFNADSRWGRLDKFSKLGIVAADQALMDAGLLGQSLPDNASLFIATRTGSVDTDSHYIQSYLPQAGMLASPNLFAYTLPGCMLGEISIRHGFRGPGMIIESSDETLIAGIITGLRYLQWGLTHLTLAGICDYDSPESRPELPCGAAMFLAVRSNQPGGFEFDGAVLTYQERPITAIPDLVAAITNERSKRTVL